jgi:uncharacterized small protein (DUF1192 family)
MLDDDPFAPSPLKKAAPSLDMLSIDELEAKVEALKREIAECERMIAEKRSVRSAADAFFGGRAS